MQESKQEGNDVKGATDGSQEGLPPRKLEEGRVYYDNVAKEEVEFGYMGQTGLAIVYEPGDSGGGMQSSWAIDPKRLTPTARRFCRACGQEIKYR
jgi:hypothetical protein